MAGDSEWHGHTKNWTLALKCLERLVEEMPHLKILLVGRDVPEHLKGKIDNKKFLPFADFLNLLGKVDILLLTSVSDASPRILTQALSVNTSVIVNRAIIGGTKYINEETGVLITDENDIVEAVKTIKERRKSGVLNPMEWFREFQRDYPKKLQIFVELLRH